MNKYDKVSKTLWIILGLNVFIAIIKLWVGWHLHLNSVLADGLHGITDSCSNIISLIGIKIASRPADKKYPFGYQKYETLASMFIGLLLFYVTIEIIIKAFSGQREIIEISGISIVLIAFTLICNFAISLWEYKKGRQYSSEVLIADSIHTRSDVIITIGVIFSMLLMHFGFSMIIDVILSLLIAIIIFLSCFKILKSTMLVLLDSNCLDDKQVLEVILNISHEIKNVHMIRSRGSKGYAYIDMHLLLAPEVTITKAHELSHLIKQALEQHFERVIDVMLHIEPYEGNVKEHLYYHDQLHNF